MSSSGENEGSGDARLDRVQATPAHADFVPAVFRNEKSTGSEETTRPAELTGSIQYLATMIVGMQGIGLTAEDRAAVEQLMAALANLLC